MNNYLIRLSLTLAGFILSLYLISYLQGCEKYTCAEPEIVFVDRPTELTTFDQLTINRAKFVCGFRYHGCLKKLVLKADKAYYAICKRMEP